MNLIDSVGKTISLTKQLMEAANTLKNADLKTTIAELQMELADIKLHLAEIVDENASLKLKVRSLESGDCPFEFKDGLYYTPEGEGPFCTTCYDTRRQRVRVARMGKDFEAIGKWRCGECKSHFQ